MKPRRWEEVDPPGPMLRALCIGNDKYGRGRFEPLPNCGNDAERVAQAVRTVPNAEATCRLNLCDKPAMKKALIEFLDQQSNRPPRVLILYCSGHGVQAGDKLYFLPTSATPTSLNELQEQCLSHEEIFRCLAEWLEKIGIKDVMCLVVIDACRTNLDGTECNQPFPDTLEPPSRPDSWALCVATARTKKAYATGYADLSSFTQHFVSDECGLFEPNVPVRGALEDVCERLRTSSNARQDPAILGLQRIPKELCLFPKKSEAVSFDVCLCYRDADKAIALSIKERLQLENNGCSVFFEAERGAPVESKISNAICNSKIIAIIISSNTFAGIDKLTEQTSCDGALGRLLWQCEMALEVYEHRRIRLLPILCGQEDKNAGRFNEMDKDALCLSCEWMEGQGRQCRQVRAEQCAQKALRLLRSDSELARELNNKNLSSFEGREIPSLLKGRRVGKMLEALSELMPFELTDAKREKAVSDIVKEMLDMLDLRPLKRLRRDDSDQSESCTSISSSQDHQLLLRRQVSPSQVLCNAVEQTFNHTGKRLRIHCDVTRIEVRWLCQRGGRVEDEEEDVWWPATICAYANREDRMGYPIWKIRYDKREGPWEDLDAHVSFRSGSVLVHEEKEKESTEKMSGKGHCQWRMNECGAQDNAEAILATGTKVKARWRGGKDWFAGKVAGINDDGTYFITYEIGGNEEAVSRELIRPQDDDTVANSNEEFWDICFRVFLAWDKFQILSVEKKSEAIDFFEGLREEIFSELVKLKDDRGRGADVGYTEIGGILDKIGFWKRLNDRLPNQPDFSGNNGSRLSSGPDCGVWRELVQGSGQRWRVQGNSYLHRNTLRERTGGVSSVSKYVRGKIQGWLSREDSEMAGEDDRYEDEDGNPIAMWKNMHEDGDCEDLGEDEVLEAIRNWEEYNDSMRSTENMCKLKHSWDTSGEVRWREGTLGDVAHYSYDYQTPVWELRYDEGHVVAKVALLDPHSLVEFQVDEATGQETEDQLTLTWRRVGDPYMPPGLEASAAAAEESIKHSHLHARITRIVNRESLDHILRLARNCANEPQNDKYRKIRLTHEKHAALLVRSEGAMDAMRALGWEEEDGFMRLPSHVHISDLDVRQLELAREHHGV